MILGGHAPRTQEGALYAIGTRVLSRTWFLARYRPATQRTMKLIDAANIKYFWKRSLGDAGQDSELTAFKVGHRVARDMLAMDRQHGGKLWFRMSDIVDAMHAGMTVSWWAPVAANAGASEAAWQATGRAVIRLTLGSMAGLNVHPDIRKAAQTANSELMQVVTQ